MSRQTFAAGDIADIAPASSGAVANTVTRTNLWAPALWTPIAAFDPKPGKAYLLRAGGIISTTGTPTIIVNPTWGQSAVPGTNLALGAGSTLTLGANLTNVPWWAEFLVGVRSLGMAAAGATISGAGQIVFGGPAATASQVLALGGTVVTNADHTTAAGICLDVTWGTAAAGNTITAQIHYVQSLN